MPCRHVTGGARAVGALADAQDAWTFNGLTSGTLTHGMREAD
jgi:hypothetical protein